MKTNNKLLADFINCENPQAWEDMPSLFEYNWNWLMQVVDKIESLGVVVEIRENVCYIETTPTDYYSELEETKIQATYNACVRFVKWYNSVDFE
jgi:hypothetical protein